VRGAGAASAVPPWAGATSVTMAGPSPILDGAPSACSSASMLAPPLGWRASSEVGQAPLRRMSQAEPPISAVLTAVSHAPSISWNSQNRESGCTVVHCV
jgi:hypothetical protein